MTGIVADIQRFSLHDGPGIRTTVFLKGCNLHCPWCHNPETWSKDPQELYFADKCIHCGHCADGCTTGARVLCGKRYTPEELLSAVARDKPFFGSDGGVTVSGGEALLQADFVREFFLLCQQAGIHTCIDTALCVPYERWESLLPLCSHFLVDVKTLNPEKARRVLGADIALLQQNLHLLDAAGKTIWIRVPCVEGWNDSKSDAERLAALLNRLPHTDHADILPVFHHGKRKEAALGRQSDETWFSPAADEAAWKFADRLKKSTAVPIMTMREH